MSAIATTYRHVRFRSRLEARWARMFDQLGWRWEYEPIDLDGYIPDFVLVAPAGPVLVEVKPEFTARDLIGAAAAKIDRSGWESTNLNAALIVGALQQTRDGPDAPAWGEAALFTCRICERPSIHHCDQAWACTICGAGDGNAHIGPAPSGLTARWSEIGNAAQWKAER